MLFGMKRVGKRLHFTATLMVALGTRDSAPFLLTLGKPGCRREAA